MDDLIRLWKTHQDAGWPRLSGSSEGELMTLDTVISGCVAYFLDSEDGLDPQRIEILHDCLADLDHLLPGVSEEASPYFKRLRRIGDLLLSTTPGAK